MKARLAPKRGACLVSLVLLGAQVGCVDWVADSGSSSSDRRAQGFVPGFVHAGFYSDAPVENNGITKDLDSLAAAAGKRVTLGGTFVGVDEARATVIGRIERIWQAKATPFVNVGIDATAAAIASGAHDADIARFAGYLHDWLAKDDRRSLILAPLQEMNGTWVPYGMDPASYKKAFRRFVDLCRMSRTQVRWTFAPNGWSSPPFKIADYYPGDAVVDIIGISAFNFGTLDGQGTWWGVAETLDPWLAELRQTVSSAKPYIIAQTGSSAEGGDKDAWVSELFAHTAADANVVAFVYFNYHKPAEGEPNFKIWQDGSVSSGWRIGMGQPLTAYQWPLDSWFHAGPLTLADTQPRLTDDTCCPAGRVCDSVTLVDSNARFHRYENLSAQAAVARFDYGKPGDVPLLGDWNCDGTRTPGMYRPSDGFIYLRNSNTTGIADHKYFFGDPGDIPLVGDFDGDGCDSIALYRPTEGRVYIKQSLGSGAADAAFYFGNPGDKPFAGDFDGDGKDTIGLHRESTGLVYLRNSNTEGVADASFIYGDPGDRILAGDWNGDGRDTVAVYRASTGTLYFRLSNTRGNADHTLTVGSYEAALTARPGDVGQ